MFRQKKQILCSEENILVMLIVKHLMEKKDKCEKRSFLEFFLY